MRTLSVAEGVAWRVLHNVFTNPSLLIPSLIFPLFFFTAFAGGLSRLDQVPARSTHRLPPNRPAPPLDPCSRYPIRRPRGRRSSQACG